MPNMLPQKLVGAACRVGRARACLLLLLAPRRPVLGKELLHAGEAVGGVDGLVQLAKHGNGGGGGGHGWLLRAGLCVPVCCGRTCGDRDQRLGVSKGLLGWGAVDRVDSGWERVGASIEACGVISGSLSVGGLRAGGRASHDWGPWWCGL